MFIVDINRHHNKACKGDCFADLELRSTAVLREQMSFIHAGDGMNAAISFLFKHLTYSVHEHGIYNTDKEACIHQS